MPSSLPPRVVVVTRPTDLELLIAEHGTRGQARFLTKGRPGWFEQAQRRDDLQRLALREVLRSIPGGWRRARIARDELPTFAFAPEDIVAAVGQDGLVANVAKYLERQPVIGINPDADNSTGILARFGNADISATLAQISEQHATYEERTLIEARLDDGQWLRAVNEVFIGHQSHQSARYRLRVREREERQSSSGVIVATGTGATGWLQSISRDRALNIQLDPSSTRLAVLVREAFAAPGFGTELTADIVEGAGVSITSEMSEGGVIFGDGMETDFLRFRWGQRVELRASATPLRLVVGKSSGTVRGRTSRGKPPGIPGASKWGVVRSA